MRGGGQRAEKKKKKKKNTADWNYFHIEQSIYLLPSVKVVYLVWIQDYSCCLSLHTVLKVHVWTYMLFTLVYGFSGLFILCSDFIFLCSQFTAFTLELRSLLCGSISDVSIPISS